MQKIYGIQYLRAFAAIAVIIFHASSRLGLQFDVGNAGVDVFFVISGVIMWMVTDRRETAPLRFLWDRVARIAPNYWIVTLVLVIGGLFGLFPRLSTDPAYIAKSLFFIPTYMPGSNMIWPVLVQGWTLNIEAFFYVAFAAVLLLPRNRQLLAMAVLLVALVGLGRMVDSHSAAFLTYTNPKMVEFVAGMGIAELWLRDRLPNRTAGLTLGAIAVIVFLAWSFTSLPSQWWLIAFAATALVLGVITIEYRHAMPKIGWLQYLGDASYSLYLWHGLGVSTAFKLTEKLHLSAPVALIVLVPSGLAIGLAAYNLVERPIASYVRSRSRRADARKVSPALSA